MNEKLKFSGFTIDGSTEIAFGWTDGDTWNGWAKPKFTRHDLEMYFNSVGWPFEFRGDILHIEFENDSPWDIEPDPQHYYLFGNPKVVLYDLQGLCWVDNAAGQ